MNVDRSDKSRVPSARETEWDLSERRSFWIALAIALMPFPVSVAISWALGSPPWRGRRPAAHEEVPHAPADRGAAHPPGDHGHR